MKVLITGANGFLGYYLTEHLLKLGHRVIATGKGDCRLPFHKDNNFRYERMDFTDPISVDLVFTATSPEIVVHAGAVSKPDDCENDQWAAYRANVEATITLLINAETFKCFFVFLSTDFIFDGIEGMYKEEDKANPVNFYGKTKAEAEIAVKEYNFNWSIARTVLVYGKPITGRGNILSVVKEKLEKGEEYKVFDDQVRTPTYIGDLVNGIVSIIEKRASGIYHLSGKEILTPYEMTCKTADFLGLDRSLIKRVTAAEFVQPAKRPLKTGFIIDKAIKDLGYDPVSFEEGLKLTFPIEPRINK